MNQEIILQVGVKVLLKNENGKFLFLRRNPKKYPEVGAVWDIPGGRIHPGMPLLENLKREVKEETGLNLEKPVTLVAAQDILKIPGRHVVRLTYTGEITGEPKIDDESLEYIWLSTLELKNIENDSIDVFFWQLIKEGVINL